MENLMKFVLIKRDNDNQVLCVNGPYTYKNALDILENGHKNLGGELYVPENNHAWAIEWHYNDYNETYWEIYPIDDEFKYPEFLE